MKAFITGISGFVGTHLAEHLLASGDQVLGCSRRGVWPPGSPAGLVAQAPLFAWDLGRALSQAEQAETLQSLVRFSPDCIYHLAAISAPGECGESSPTPQAERVNVGGLADVLRLARLLPAPPRVLFVSSSHVYAPATAEQCRLREDSPLGPRRGYGMTKLAAEDLLRQAVAQGADALVARAFQHLGPRQASWSMLSQWARQFAQAASGPIRVYNCSTKVDVTDVRDMVRAYRHLVLMGQRGETYNVGLGVARQTGDILRLLRELAGPDRPIHEVAPGPRWDPIADIGRLTACTGWRPEVPLEQTVADTLAWWQARLADTETWEEHA